MTTPTTGPPDRARRLRRLRRLRLLGRLRRRVLLHRRPLAALSAAGAVLLGLQAVSPSPPATVSVWTASHDLSGGSTLGRDDLTLSRLPPSAVPDGALTGRRASGRVLAAPMSRGEVLTGRRLLDRGLLAGYPGRDAVPVRLTDAGVVDLLRVGDRVTLVAADPDGQDAVATLARGVPVIALPRPGRPSLSTGEPGRLAVLAVPSVGAEDVAARALGGYLTVIWSG